MAVGKPHPFFGQLIEIGRRDLAFRVVATEIPKPEVVGIEKENIGLRRGSGSQSQNKKERKQGGSHAAESVSFF